MRQVTYMFVLMLAACSGSDKCGENPGRPSGSTLFPGSNAEQDRQDAQARWEKWSACERAKEAQNLKR